ncbi:MAG: DUF5666 domain-containing protein [Terriglobales bacterium]
MKRFPLIAMSVLICALLLATMALAHGGMEHVLGTVTAVTNHSLSVKTRDGALQTVEFDGETKFVKGEAAATVKDVRVGSRVVIHAHKNANSLHAAEVNIGADAAPSQH